MVVIAAGLKAVAGASKLSRWVSGNQSCNGADMTMICAAASERSLTNHGESSGAVL